MLIVSLPRRGTDFLCNAGGVVVSYSEIVQNRNIDHREKDMVQSRPMMTITDIYRRAGCNGRGKQDIIAEGCAQHCDETGPLRP